jgi:hypothetical protein
MQSWNKTAEELIPALNALAQTLETRLAQSTEQLAAFASGIRNDALEVATIVLPAAPSSAEPTLGIWSHKYRVPYGWVSVTAVNPGELVVTNGERQPVRPTDGRGVVIVPAATDGRGTAIRMTGEVLTIYGTAGARVVVQVLTVPAPTMGGIPT